MGGDAQVRRGGPLLLLLEGYNLPAQGVELCVWSLSNVFQQVAFEAFALAASWGQIERERLNLSRSQDKLALMLTIPLLNKVVYNESTLGRCRSCDRV